MSGGRIWPDSNGSPSPTWPRKRSGRSNLKSFMYVSFVFKEHFWCGVAESMFCLNFFPNDCLAPEGEDKGSSEVLHSKTPYKNLHLRGQAEILGFDE